LKDLIDRNVIIEAAKDLCKNYVEMKNMFRNGEDCGSKEFNDL